MNPGRIIDNFYLKIKIANRNLMAREGIKMRKKWLKLQGKTYIHLNQEQRRLTKELWGRNADVSLHEIFLSLFGEFNPYLCPYRLLLSQIGILCNDQKYLTAWDDKNYYELFHRDIAIFPKTVIHNVQGTFMDKDYILISEEKALEMMKKYDELIIKPSTETGDGKGIKKITPHSEDIKELLRKYGRDYIIQEVIKQHKSLSVLNPSSVNVIRFNSILIDGRVIPLTASLKCGPVGSITDNAVTPNGRGGVAIGIDENGYLKDTAYFMNGESINKLENGAEFKGLQIPSFSEIKSIVEKVHSRMPFFMFVGFDIAVNAESEPIVVEYNVKGPGNFLYQYTNGPTFGTYTNDVIRWLKSKHIIK